MQRFAEKLLTAFQLTRLSLVFGAIADVWFVVIYTRNDTRYDLLPVFEMPLAIDLVTAALLAIGLAATTEPTFFRPCRRHCCRSGHHWRQPSKT